MRSQQPWRSRRRSARRRRRGIRTRRRKGRTRRTRRSACSRSRRRTGPGPSWRAPRFSSSARLAASKPRRRLRLDANSPRVPPSASRGTGPRRWRWRHHRLPRVPRPRPSRSWAGPRTARSSALSPRVRFCAGRARATTSSAGWWRDPSRWRRRPRASASAPSRHPSRQPSRHPPRHPSWTPRTSSRSSRGFAPSPGAFATSSPTLAWRRPRRLRLP